MSTPSGHTAPACPRCAGPWLNGWRWQHETSCPLLPVLDATHASDAERIRSTRAGFQRAPNTAEAALWGAVTGQPLTRPTTVIPLTSGIPAACIAGIPSAAPTTTR